MKKGFCIFSLLILLLTPFSISAESINIDSNITFSQSISSKSVEYANYTSVNFTLVSNYDGQRDGTAYKTYDSGATRFYYLSAVKGSRASSMSATIKDFSDYSNYYTYDSIVITGGGSTSLNLPSGFDISEFDVGFDIVAVDSQESTTSEDSGFISVTKNTNSFTINYNVPSRGGYYLFGYTIVPYLYYNSIGSVDPDPTPPPVNSFSISGSVNPSNSGIINGLGTYEEGSSVTLTAIPNDGYTFSNWSNGLTSQSIEVVVTSDINITANFQSNPTSNGQILRITTFTNPQTYINSNGTETFVYDVTYTYYGSKLDVYYQNSLVQSGVDTFSYSYTGRPYSNFPSVPHYDLAESFSIDNYIVTVSNSSDGIVVTNPNTDNLITNGNGTSQAAQNSNNQMNNNLNNTLDNFENIENQYNQNITDNLNQIDLNFNSNNFGSNFLSSAQWFTTQFNNIVLDTPLNGLIIFSCVVGLGLLLLGRFL